MDSLLNSLGLDSSAVKGVSGFDPETSWQICTIILGVLVTAGLFAYFTYFKKGSKRKIGEDVKNFFLFKANFAEDLARIVFYYMTFDTIMLALKTLTTYGKPWGFFEILFRVVYIRFIYELVLLGVRFCKSNTKKEEAEK